MYRALLKKVEFKNTSGASFPWHKSEPICYVWMLNVDYSHCTLQEIKHVIMMESMVVSSDISWKTIFNKGWIFNQYLGRALSQSSSVYWNSIFNKGWIFNQYFGRAFSPRVSVWRAFSPFSPRGSVSWGRAFLLSSTNILGRHFHQEALFFNKG